MPLKLFTQKRAILKWTILPAGLILLALLWASCWPGLNFAIGKSSPWFGVERFSRDDSGHERRYFCVKLASALFEIETGAQPLGPCGPRPHRGLVFGHSDIFQSDQWTVTLRGRGID